MNPFYQDEHRTLYAGDNRLVLPSLPSDFYDSCVTDPPAGIGFMNKEWDKDKGGRDAWIAWMTELMKEVLRTLKPGAHALVWALPRTSHWTATALENAGFEIRDICTHIFATGFPKSLNVSKALQEKSISCQCHTDAVQCHNGNTAKDVRSMWPLVDAEDPLSSNSESNMLAEVRGDYGTANLSDENKAASDLPDLQDTVHPKESDGVEQGEVLRCGMLWSVACGESGDKAALKKDRAQGQIGVDGREPQIVLVEDDGRKESRLEGRSNLLSQTRQLRADQVCPLPVGVSTDGTKGRLHNGASLDHGSDGRAMSDARRGSPPQGSQSSQQSPEEPSVISQQPRPQTCGSCGKPRIPQGLGTALKPATEHWILCRKPTAEKSVAANFIEYGTGGLNIDACRVAAPEGITTTPRSDALHKQSNSMGASWSGEVDTSTRFGRWPANFILSHAPDCNGSCVEGCPVLELDKQSGTLISNGGKGAHTISATENRNANRSAYSNYGASVDRVYGDEGGASRFFYVSKPSPAERNEGLEDRPTTNVNDGRQTSIDNPYQRGDTPRRNIHPTVKPIELMRYLVRLITPEGGTVIDPFMGSGTAGIACELEGRNFVGIELDETYCDIALKRIRARCFSLTTSFSTTERQ